jgi:hypothetical protein
MTTLGEINIAHSEFQDEYQKFQSGNKAAGRRARKALMDTINSAKALRKEITEETNK